MFLAVRQTVPLSLNTPLDICCNCSSRENIDLVETPLRRTRYFFLAGTELTLLETFPYCRRCRGSAARERLGALSKLAVAGIVAMAVFIALVALPIVVPELVRENVFAASAAIATALTLGYFALRERDRPDRSYYQPVSLAAVDVAGDTLRSVTLRFFNKRYAALFSAANADVLKAGAVRVVTGA